MITETHETDGDTDGGADTDAVIAHADVTWVVADAEVVVHELSTSATYLLDPVASVLWQCLDAQSPLGEIFFDIAEVMGVDYEVIVTDCLPVIASWLDVGIVRRVDSPSRRALAEVAAKGRTWRLLVDPPNS